MASKNQNRTSKALPKKKPDDFASVAARLECDPDLEKFDKKLAKIAKVSPDKKTR